MAGLIKSFNSSSNVIGPNKNIYQYNLISDSFHAKDCEMAVSSLAIPYSWFNVTSFYNNQSFTIVFPYLTVFYIMNITLPNGFYSVSDINNYVQLECIKQGLYLTSGGLNYYYFNIVVNTSLYAVQIVLSLVPSTLPSGFAQPATGWWSSSFGLPTVARTPTFCLPATGSIGSLIGFAPGVILGPSTTTSLSFTSTSTPVGSTVNGLLIRCSLVNNSVTQPSDILDAVPINATFGANITYNPSFQKWIKMRDGRYSSMTITFVDQNLNTLYSVDPNILLTILLRKKDLI
jgi:hypothetical protein